MAQHTIQIVINAVTKKFEKGVGDAKKLIGKFLGALTVGAILAFSKALFELGLRVEGLRARLVGFTGGAGAMRDMVRKIREETDGLVSEMDALSIGSDLLAYHLANTSEEAAELTRKIMIVTGGSTDAAKEFAIMMANMSPQRLDTFALSSGRVTARMNELAAENANLTREQRWNIAVTEELDRVVAKLGGTLDTTGAKVQKASVTMKDVWTDLGEGIVVGFAPLIGLIEKAVQSFVGGSVEVQNAALLWSAAMQLAYDPEVQKRFLKTIQKYEGDMRRAWEAYLVDLGAISTEQSRAADEAEALAAAEARAAEEMGDVGKKAFEAAEAIKKVAKETGGLKEELGGISDMTGGEDIFGFEGLFEEMDKAGEMAEKGLKGAAGVWGAEGGEIDELAMERAILSFMRMRGLPEHVIIAYMVKVGLATEEQVAKWHALMALVTALEKGEIGLEEFIAGTEMVEAGNIAGLSSLGMKIPKEGFGAGEPASGTSSLGEGTKDVNVTVNIKYDNEEAKKMVDVQVEEGIKEYNDETWLEGVGLG